VEANQIFSGIEKTYNLWIKEMEFPFWFFKSPIEMGQQTQASPIFRLIKPKTSFQGNTPFIFDKG